MTDRLSVKIVYTNLAIVLTISILYFGKPVFMPLAIAGVIALVFIPLCNWIEKRGLAPLFAAVLCGVIFSLMFTGVILFITHYLKQMTADMSGFTQMIHEYNHTIRQYLHNLPPPIPEEAGEFGKMAAPVMGVALSFVINMILILIYMIMLLCIRGQIKIFILKLVRPEFREETRDVISRSAKVVQRYLTGLFLVIVCLWVMYTIGFSLIGVHNALFFAILCGLLEVIPFVGNITGSTLTSIMALSQGGGMGMVLSVLGTYAVIQFIQFYIITPLVMREQVNIHPLFTIVILIAGELVWGIPGMILAIPALGIFKIVCDHVEALYPFGYLIGNHGKRKRRSWTKK